MKEAHPHRAHLPLFLLGTSGLKRILETEAGFECIGYGSDHHMHDAWEEEVGA